MYIRIQNLVGENADYASGPYYIMFNTGMSRAHFEVKINDDNEMEDDEEFTLIINTDSLPSNIFNGTHTKANVIITSTDGKLTVPF